MKRKNERVTAVLPVRLYGMDDYGKPFNIMVRTIDVSPNGARLHGIELALKPGSIIGMQYGVERARCRVVWTGNADFLTAQIGVTMLLPNKRFWAIEFRETKDTFNGAHKVIPADASPRIERRKNLRYACKIGTELTFEDSPTVLWGQCSDISAGGCYIETRSPAPEGSRVRIRLRTEIALCEASCIVCTTHPLLGMGVRFEDLSEENAQALRKILEQVENNPPIPGAPPVEKSPEPPPEIARLQKLVTTLNSMIDTAADCFTDPAALLAFRQAIRSALMLASDVESAYHMSTPFAAAMPVAVLKYRTRVLADIGADLAADHKSVECTERDVEQLRAVLREMEDNISHLAPPLHEANPAAIPPEVILFPMKSIS